jgi:hypothetical protein
VPPYLAHTWAALLQLATTSAVPPLLHQTSGGSVPRPFGAQVEVRSFPRTVSSFKRVATRRDFSCRIAPTGSLGRGGEASPDHACFLPTAQSRTTPEFPDVYSLASHAPAGGFGIASRLAIPRAPYSRVRDPIARSFASEPPGPRLAATPYHFGYPVQERSTGAGLTPARRTHCRPYWRGSLDPCISRQPICRLFIRIALKRSKERVGTYDCPQRAGLMTRAWSLAILG